MNTDVVLKNGEKYYNIRLSDGGVDVVAGKPCKIKRLPKMRFFTSRNKDGSWDLNEVTTGCGVLNNRRTRSDILKAFESNKQFLIDRFCDRVEKKKKIDEYINDVVRIPKEKPQYKIINKQGKLNVADREGNIERVNGYLVTFEQAKEFSFFVCETRKEKWCCCEYKTGLAGVNYSKTKIGCVRDMMKYIKGFLDFTEQLTGIINNSKHVNT